VKKSWTPGGGLQGMGKRRRQMVVLGRSYGKAPLQANLVRLPAFRARDA